MIYVLATARIRQGCLAEALACYREFVPAVLANEPGCIEYVPSVDVDAGLPNQEACAGSILVTERWRSIDDFHRHLAMPHCATFRTRLGPLLQEGITVRILRPAW